MPNIVTSDDTPIHYEERGSGDHVIDTEDFFFELDKECA